MAVQGTYAFYVGGLARDGGGGGGGGGITSINGGTEPAQIIAAGSGIGVVSASGTTTISNTATASDSFVIMQPITGTAPTASSTSDTLTFTSSDSQVTVNGDSVSKALDFGLATTATLTELNYVHGVTSSIQTQLNGLQPSGGYITALTGDVVANGPGSAVATLATINSGPGTYTNATVTVNGKGLVTAASSGTAPVTSVGASSPLASSGGTTPNISITGSSLTETTSSVLTITGGTASQLDPTTIQVKQSSGSLSGYLSSTDWTTFNNKQSALTFSDSLVNAGGTVTLLNDNASPGVSEYYGTDSLGAFGYHSLSVGAGANTALSNLSAVAVNTTLLPGNNNTIDLGSPSLTWDHAYLGTQLLTPLITGLGSTGAAITVRGGLAAASGAGGAITVTGAVGDSGNGAGGNATVSGGSAGGSTTVSSAGGSVSITGGQSYGSSTGGTVTITCGTGGIGTGSAGATGGTVNINGGTGGAGSGTSANGGGATLKGGSGGAGVAGGQGGTAQLTGGSGGTGSASGGNGGAANLQGGSPANFAGAAGGTITIAAGNGTGTGSGGAGGSVTINTGVAGGDNTANETGGSFTLAVGHSIGSSGGAQVQMTAGTGGVGTSTAGASGGAFNINAGAGGAGSGTGGGGGNVVIEAGAGGNSGTPGAGGYIQFQTASTTSFTEKLRILAAGGVNVVNGLLNITTAGNGLAISHGSNCKLGTSTLSGGSVVVSNTAVTSSSYIFLTIQSPSGTVGSPYISTKTAGTSFTIASTSGSDNSTVAWMIVEAI